MKILLIYSSHHENECGGWLGLVRLGYILAYIVSDMLVGEKSPVPFGSIVPPTPTRVPPPKQPLSASWNFLGSRVFCCYFTTSVQFYMKSDIIWDRYQIPLSPNLSKFLV